MTERLQILRNEIVELHRRGEASQRQSLDDYRAAGERLIEAKELVKHGEWLPWLAEAGLSPRVAQRYMCLARIPTAKYDSESFLSIAAALDQLGEKHETFPPSDPLYLIEPEAPAAEILYPPFRHLPIPGADGEGEPEPVLSLHRTFARPEAVETRSRHLIYPFPPGDQQVEVLTGSDMRRSRVLAMLADWEHYEARYHSVEEEESEEIWEAGRKFRRKMVAKYGLDCKIQRQRGCLS